MKKKQKKVTVILIIVSACFLLFWSIFPSLLGCYYFYPSTRLDGSVGTIIFMNNGVRMCTVGGSSSSVFISNKNVKYIDDVIIISRNDGAELTKLKTIRKFFYIRWKEIGNTKEDWNYELPCYNPYFLFKTLILRFGDEKQYGISF